MAKIQRNFAAGRMNKSIDERLLPNGEYVHAENVRLGSTENSEIGSVEVAKGNEKITTLVFPLVSTAIWTTTALSASATCIGSYADEPTDTIYWFVHDPAWTGAYPTGGAGTPICDMIISYNTLSGALIYHVISIWDGDSSATQYKTILNFNPKHLITGVDKVKDLLFFTDDYNPPRVINVKKNYAYPGDLTVAATPTNPVDQFLADDILVIKQPPTESPIVSLSALSVNDNYLSDRFISFAYRYKYENNEFSAPSQFSDVAFLPKLYSVSSDTALNKGMNNKYSQAKITFNTGGPLVKAVEILFKEADSSTIKVVETLDKEENSYSDNEIQQITFDNSKVFSILPEYEILRTYDNVPRKAKAQTIMGNRLMYGNYIDNYNLTRDNVPINLDYTTSIVSEEIGASTVGTALSSETYNTSGLPATTVTNAKITLTFSAADYPLKSGATLSISFTLAHFTPAGVGQFVELAASPPATQPSSVTPPTTIGWSYTLNQDYPSAGALAISPSFQQAIGIGPASSTATGAIQTVQNCSAGTTLTDIINCAFSTSLTGGSPTPMVPYTSGASLANGGGAAGTQPTPSQGQALTIGYTDNTITILLNPMIYVDVIASPTAMIGEFLQFQDQSAGYQIAQGNKSLHSNRGYEVGIVYLDKFNRATTALTSGTNTAYVDCNLSDSLNRVKITIPPSQLAPSWATSFRFAIKPTETTYQTVFTLLGLQDSKDGSWWFLLEGENSRKVEVGDKLIVKKDAQGALFSCEYNSVIDKGAKESGFIQAKNPTYNPEEGQTDDANNPGTGANPEFLYVPSGVYMQMKNLNFIPVSDTANAVYPTNTWPVQQECVTGLGEGGDTCRVNFRGLSGDPQGADNLYTPFAIPSGSRIRLKIKVKRKGNQTFPALCPEREYLYDKTWFSNADYSNIIEWFQAMGIAESLQDPNYVYSAQGADPEVVYINTVQDNANDAVDFPSTGFAPTIYVGWNYNQATGQIVFGVKSFRSCTGASTGFATNNNDVKLKVRWEIDFGGSGAVFETKPDDALPNLWYESSATYPIDTATGYHLGQGYDVDPQNAALGKRYPENQNQAAGVSAVITTAFFNCFAFGNGVESYRIDDSIIAKSFTLGNRTTSTITDEYKESDRFADITYSGVFQDETNINKLNEFNLGLANYKILEDTYGAIEILSSRKTDILVLQEDKISYVLAGKNLLSDAAGGGAISSVPEVLGTQISRIEEYGISNNPESFAIYGRDKFFTDAKRGAVLQLKGESGGSETLTVISERGMRSWFRDAFNGTLLGYEALGGDTQRIGGFDPYMNEYVLSLNDNAIAVPPVVFPCGTDISAVLATSSTVVYDIELGNLIGTVTWNLNTVEATDFSVSWNGVVVATGTTVATVTEVITFSKTAGAPSTATITLTNTSADNSSTTLLEPDCVTPTTLTVVQVIIGSSTGGNMNYAFTMYDWELGGVNSGYVPTSPWYSTWTTDQTPSGAGYDLPLVNWQSNTYNLGQNGAPLDGSTVNMYIRAEDFPLTNGAVPPNQFPFDPYKNTFSYLRTATAYNPTAVDAMTLLAASTIIPTPYEKWDNASVPANWTNTSPTDALDPQYRADFTMPATGQEYLYLIWDLRNITEKLLCYSNLNLEDVCCECSCGVGVCTKYRITNNNLSTVVTFTYTNCSGIVTNTEVPPSTATNPYVDICSTTDLTNNVSGAVMDNITVTIEACGLPCP